MAEEIELFKKKLSKEEKLYIEAVKLQEAVSCVLRFEQKVISLKSAARKFESLGDYKDSKTRMEECSKQAAIIREEGLKETFELAMAKKEKARTKSDYADVIAEFKRVVKREAYRDRAKEQIQLCKKEIARMETRAAWKRRLIALVVIVICVLIAVVSTKVFSSAKERVTSKNYKAVSSDKAEYLGFGRLYPFKASDGTGALYYFTTSAKRSYYQIKAFVEAGNRFQIALYDEAGNLVRETEFADSEYYRFALMPEKKYFLQLSGSYNAAGEILVSEIADDYANDLTGAQELALNEEFMVTTDCFGDFDYLKLTTSAQDVIYTLNIDPVSGVVGGYEVLNEAGESIADCSGTTDTANKLVTVLPIEPEKIYYLKFSSAETYCQLLVSVDTTVRTYNLAYHLNGGENNKANPATYVATDTIALKSPTKKGYVFEGWFADAEYTKAIYNIGGFGKRDYELYAKWKEPEPATVTVKSYVSKSAGKATLIFHAVPEVEGYQIRITRIGKKKNYVSYETVKRTTVNFSNWKKGQKYYVNVRAYVLDSCGNRVYGTYSKTEGITVKKSKKKK